MPERLDALQAEHEALQAAYRRLQRTDRLRQELVGMLVHDLKSPLAVVLAGLDLLSDDLDRHLGSELRGELHGKLQELCSVAHHAGEEMLQLITNLLELQRLEAGRMPLHRQPLDVPLLLQAAVQRVQFTAQQRDVAVRLGLAEGLPLTWADPDLVERIVANLLDNALRFSPDGGQVEIDARHQNSHLLVSVADQGPGIPAAQQEALFEPFNQVAPSPQRGPISVGLGLAFCKLAVEAQRGRIWIESPPGQGARFCFTLPAWQVG